MLVADSFSVEEFHQTSLENNTNNTNLGNSSSPPALLSAVAKGITSLANIRGLDTMTHLLSLNLHLNAIHRIESHCLAPLVNLVEINLSGNQLTRIEGLSSLKNLRSLDLSCNRIEVVEGLRGLVHLRKVMLSSNRICSLRGFGEILGHHHYHHDHRDSKTMKKNTSLLLGQKDINRGQSSSTFHVEEVTNKKKSHAPCDKNDGDNKPELEFIDLRNNRLDSLIEFKYLAGLPELKQLRLRNTNSTKNFPGSTEKQLISAFGPLIRTGEEEEQQQELDYDDDISKPFPTDDSVENGFFDALRTHHHHRTQQHHQDPTATRNQNQQLEKKKSTATTTTTTKNSRSGVGADDNNDENPICLTDPDYLFRVSEVCPQILMIDQIAVAMAMTDNSNSNHNNNENHNDSNKNNKNKNSSTTTTAIGNPVSPNSKFAELRHSSEYPLVSATMRFREQIIKKEKETKQRENPKPDLSDDPVGSQYVYQKQYATHNNNNNSNLGLSIQLSRRNSIRSTATTTNDSLEKNQNRLDISSSSTSMHEQQQQHQQSTKLTTATSSSPRLSVKTINRGCQTDSADNNNHANILLERQEQEETNQQLLLAEEENSKLKQLLSTSEAQLSEKSNLIHQLESDIDNLEGILDEERRDFDRSKQHWELELQRADLAEEKLKMKLEEEILNSQHKIDNLNATHRDQTAALKSEIERLQFVTRNSAKETESVKSQLEEERQSHNSKVDKLKRDYQRRVNELDERLQTAQKEIKSLNSSADSQLRNQKQKFDDFLEKQYELWSLQSEETERRQQLITSHFFFNGIQRYERELLINISELNVDLEMQLTEIARREADLRHKMQQQRNQRLLITNASSGGSTDAATSTASLQDSTSTSIACGDDKPISATIIVDRERWTEMGKRFDSALNEAEHARKTTTDAFNSLLEEKNRSEALEEALSSTQDELKSALANLAKKETELDDCVSKHDVEVQRFQTEIEYLRVENEELKNKKQQQQQTENQEKFNTAQYYVELRDELQRMKKERDDIDRENVSLRDRVSEIERDLAEKSSELEECISQAQEKINEKRSRIHDLELEREQLRISLSEKITEKEEMAKTLETQHLLQQQLRSASEISRSHVVAITEALELEHIRNQDLIEKVNNLEKQKSELSSELEKVKESSKRKMQEMAKLFQQE